MTSKKDIANTLADDFSEKYSSENYSAKFSKIKDQQEKQKLKFTSDNTETHRIGGKREFRRQSKNFEKNFHRPYRVKL